MGFFDFLKKKELSEIQQLNIIVKQQNLDISSLQDHIEELSKYEGIIDADAKSLEIISLATIKADNIISEARNLANKLNMEAKEVLRQAEEKASRIDSQVQQVFEKANSDASNIRKEASSKASELRSKAKQVLDEATQQSATIISKAHIKAEEIAGDAYKLKLESTDLEKTVIALKNTVKGYGDDYIIPSYSLIDELADDFGYTEAGNELKRARERTKLMVKNGTAAKCDYVEEYRRITAIDFITDAFNGKVDSILTTVKQDNFGTLKQKIIDAYYLVNNLGKAFRNAIITSEYLDARVDELKWSAACTELKIKEREEQRLIKEQIREEERAQREIEKAIKEAAKEEDTLKKAIEKVQLAVSKATEEQKALFEAQLNELSQKLKEAEEKNQRALSMAQQTRSGHVYVISNIGSFGEEVFKIGMTRRLEPTDRVRELGDASVPFPFDIHAMIFSDDAPGLETILHKVFVRNQLNKVNPRKEFFRVSISDIRKQIDVMNVQTKWTMAADAYEWRETLAIEKAIEKDSSVQDEWANKQLREALQKEYENIEN